MKKLRESIFSVGALQIFSYGIQFAMIPYLASVLGVQGFGRLVFIQAVMQYLALIVNWGFWGESSRRISLNRYRPAIVKRVFSSAWCGQWLIFILISLVAVVLVLLVKDVSAYFYDFLAGYVFVAAAVLMPNWIFQALELTKISSIVQIFAKVSMFPLVFVFVTDSEHGWLALLLINLPLIISGLYLLFWLNRRGHVVFFLPEMRFVIAEIKKCLPIFLSQIWISSYLLLTPVVLGVVEGSGAVGIYAMAEKIKNIALTMLSPITQTLFPRMSYLWGIDKSRAKKFLKTAGSILIALSFVGGCVIFFAAGHLVALFGGDEFANSVEILRLMSVLPIFVTISGVIGMQILLPLKQSFAYGRIYAAAALISLSLLYPLVLLYGVTGAVVSMIFAEATVALCMLGYLIKCKRKIFL